MRLAAAGFSVGDHGISRQVGGAFWDLVDQKKRSPDEKSFAVPISCCFFVHNTPSALFFLNFNGLIFFIYW
jgi:hypothetical protein